MNGNEAHQPTTRSPSHQTYRFRLNDCRYPNLQWCDDLEIHPLDLTKWTPQLPRQQE